MDNPLPKHLGLTLDALLKDSMLTSWTIQSNSSMTSVIIRFRPDTDGDIADGSVDNTTKYKRVAKSQLKRDKTRANDWSEQCDNSGDIATNIPTDIVKPKAKSTVVSTRKVQHSANPPTDNGNIGSRTRSRLISYAPVSPVTQVDGPTDSKPTQGTRWAPI